MPTRQTNASQSAPRSKAGRPKSLNPLAVAFGSALRQVRDKQGKSTKEIAADSGEVITNSFYRLIESGRNNPSVAKAPFLHQKFQGEPKLEYEPLVFLIATIAASEERTPAQNQKNTSRGNQLHENISSICHAFPANHQFRILLTRFLTPLRQRGIPNTALGVDCSAFQALDAQPKSVREIVADAKLDTEVIALLTQYGQYVPLSQAPREYAQTFFDPIASVYKPLLDAFKNHLTYMPKAVVPEGSWEWEAKIKHEFKELVAVCYAKHVLALENLRQYKFDYLWNDNFTKATFILLDEATPEQPHKRFWDNLTRVLSDNRSSESQRLLQQLGERLKAKTVFLSSDAQEKKELTKLLSEHSFEHFVANAMWFFKTTDSAIIGAAAHIDDKKKSASGIKFLTFADCERALPVIAQSHPEIES